MQKKGVEGKIQPIKKSNSNLILAIIIIALILLVLFVIAYVAYYYFSKQVPPIEAQPNQTNVNDTTPINDSTRDTLKPKTQFCGNGSCDKGENYTNCPKDCKKPGGGGGDSGPSNPLPSCTTGAWTDTTEYRCSASGERERKQTRTICPAGTEEQWIAAPCQNGYVCNSTGQCIELASCVPYKNCSYYHNQGQCGIDLNDGCTNSLYCLNCPDDGKCVGGTCVYPEPCTSNADCVLSFPAPCTNYLCNLSAQKCYFDFNSSDDICRPAASECDQEDYCFLGECDLDRKKADETPCSLGTCQNGQCVESITCLELTQPNSVNYLTKNEGCVRIMAENVTLDCANYKITNNQMYVGIYSNYSNTTILNCNINRTSLGIYFENSDKGLISNVNLTENSEAINRDNDEFAVDEFWSTDASGIYMLFSDLNKLENLIIYDEKGDAIDLTGAYNNTLNNINILDGSTGVHIDQSWFNILENINSSNNNNYGIEFKYPCLNWVRKSEFCNNQNDVFCFTDQSEFSNNTCTGSCGSMACTYSCPENKVIPISGCGDLDVEGGNYLLTRDIITTSWNCFRINSDNITLDCAGKSIIGPGENGDNMADAGIFSSIQQGLVVKNCNVSNFEYGIFFGGINKSKIENSVLNDNEKGGLLIVFSHWTSVNGLESKYNGKDPDGHGIRLQYDSNITLENIDSSYNLGNGIDIWNSPYNKVINFNIIHNRWGVEIDTFTAEDFGGNDVFEGGNITNNKNDGFSLDVPNVTIKNSYIFDNGGDGLYSNNGSNTFTNLFLNNNSDDGIYLVEGNNTLINILVNNTVGEFGGFGIVITGPDNFLKNVTSTHSKWDGFYLLNVNDSVFDELFTGGNGGDGFDVYYTNFINLSHSKFCGDSHSIFCDIDRIEFFNNTCDGHCAGRACTNPCPQQSLIQLSSNTEKCSDDPVCIKEGYMCDDNRIMYKCIKNKDNCLEKKEIGQCSEEKYFNVNGEYAPNIVKKTPQTEIIEIPTSSWIDRLVSFLKALFGL